MFTTATPTFTGTLLTPESPDYDDARRVWNGAIDRRPAFIARCTSTADVAAALAFARRHDLAVAVRGGGHSIPGWSVIDGGLVIDLTEMKRIDVDPATRTAVVEPGVTWGELDAATQEYGLATPGGEISHTGVAGLTLGVASAGSAACTDWPATTCSPPSWSPRRARCCASTTRQIRS
jgi:FAD/FMN-containing dehydrogenase